jgi:hypothetical protein
VQKLENFQKVEKPKISAQILKHEHAAGVLWSVPPDGALERPTFS